MAGAIAGRFNRNGKSVKNGEIMKMLSLLGGADVHREGVLPEGNVGLGQMTLPIKMQWEENSCPVWNKGNKLAITASAFLLNRNELLEQLSVSPEQHRLTGNSDLILMAYERWDIHSPEKLEGNFAFAIWDLERKRLFCARSHLGNSTFCYSLNEKTFIFATEVKSILEASGVGAQLNHSFLCDFVLDLHCDSESTAFEGVKHLPSAHAMLIEGSKHRIWKYWDLKEAPDISFRNPEDYCAAANELLEKLVRSHLVTEEKTGLHIRGNMKSAALASIATPLMRQQGKDIFSVSYALAKDYQGQCRDDSPYTEEIGREYGLNVQYVNERCFPPPFDDDIEKKFSLQDSPQVNPIGSDHDVIFGTLQKQGVKLVLNEIAPMDFRRLFGVTDFALKGEWKTFWRELSKEQKLWGKGLPSMISSHVLMPLLPDSLYQALQFRHKGAFVERASIINDRISSDLVVVDRVRSHVQNKRLRKSMRESLAHNFTGLPGMGKKYMSAQERRYDLLLHSPFDDKRLQEFIVGIAGRDNHFYETSSNIFQEFLKGKIPESLRVNPIRASYPADMPDRHVNEASHILREFGAMQRNDAVWDYINRNRVMGMLEQVGSQLHLHKTWRSQTPRILVRIILLQRFLKWVPTAFGSKGNPVD